LAIRHIPKRQHLEHTYIITTATFVQWVYGLFTRNARRTNTPPKLMRDEGRVSKDAIGMGGGASLMPSGELPCRGLNLAHKFSHPITRPKQAQQVVLGALLEKSAVLDTGITTSQIRIISSPLNHCPQIYADYTHPQLA
jgi:hypothetical protein